MARVSAGLRVEDRRRVVFLKEDEDEEEGMDWSNVPVDRSRRRSLESMHPIRIASEERVTVKLTIGAGMVSVVHFPVRMS